MILTKYQRVVGVFTHRRDAEQALHELRDSGLAMEKVSVIVQNVDRNHEITGDEIKERTSDKADEGATVGGLSGGAVGGLTGLLVGLGTLAIPGVGPIMLAGAAATALVTTLVGASIGAATGTFAGALVGWGISEEKARAYNERVEHGHYFIIVDCTSFEIAKVEAILHRWGIEEFGIYEPVSSEQLSTNYLTTTTATTMPNKSGILTKYAISCFNNIDDAEAAINDMYVAGFSANQISLICQDFSQLIGSTGVNLSERFDAMRLGIPDDWARFYNEQIDLGNYILIVSGADNELEQAGLIVGNYGVQECQIYDPMLIRS
ncbi:general stress protein [Nostoc sp. UHCC 0252]|uniref:general stress protein n=1 Tax=Nostoc sp. UHCC 0252 TaxID=3110241 RepID=UPI002B213651|nr:general stress protein [Nostoc sp. UHCC 0252]MEA5602020.1 general stress protein [Nostoc sp. UHCC 0252]